MVTIIQNNIVKWNVSDESILFITSSCTASGKTTLTKKLARENNALSISIDDLMCFIRYKFIPIEYQHLNITQLEGQIDDYSILCALNFFKEKYFNLFKKVKDCAFDSKEYKNYLSLINWMNEDHYNEYIEYLIKKFRYYNQLVIVEGMQLINFLIKDENEKYLNEIPLLILDTPKIRAIYQFAKRRLYGPGIVVQDNLKEYLKAVCYMLTKGRLNLVKYLQNSSHELDFNTLKNKLNNNFNQSEIDEPINFKYDILPKELNELKELNNWVVYRNFKHGKLPFNPVTNLIVKTNDPNTWAPYNVALNIFQNHSYYGIGFVFSSKDDYIGIDLDDCVDELGNVNFFAQKIINMLNSYTEYSPSNKGLHIICKAKLLKNQNIGIKKNNIEIYNNDRFFTMTGNMYLKKEIIERSNEIIELIKLI